MLITDHLKYFNRRVNRIGALYSRAIEAGELEKAQKLEDELYGVYFDHYRYMMGFGQDILKKADEQEEPRTKEVFEEIGAEVRLISEGVSSRLNDFVSRTLKQ